MNGKFKLILLFFDSNSQRSSLLTKHMTSIATKLSIMDTTIIVNQYVLIGSRVAIQVHPTFWYSKGHIN